MNFFRKKNFNLIHVLQVLGLIILFIVTVLGIRGLFQEDWRSAINLVWSRCGWVALALLIRIIDWMLDFLLWRYMVSQYRIKVDVLESIWMYFTQGAGIILPAQLGRILRAWVLCKKKSVSLLTAVSLELFFLACVFVGGMIVIMVSLGTMSGYFLSLCALSFVGLTCFALVLKLPIFDMFKKKIIFPEIKPLSIFLFCLLASVGWFLNGLIFYFILGVSDSTLSLSQVQVLVLGNLFVGILSGIPGGIGLVETTLSISLHWLNVNTIEMIVSVFLFRIITFWLWIPLGWLALFMLHLHREIFSMNSTVDNINVNTD